MAEAVKAELSRHRPPPAAGGTEQPGGAEFSTAQAEQSGGTGSEQPGGAEAAQPSWAGSVRVGVICYTETVERVFGSGLEQNKELLVIAVESAFEYARELYRAFERFDAAGCGVIVAEWPEAAGIGRALRDRLWRASGGTPESS
jgi:hypothetical protein